MQVEDGLDMSDLLPRSSHEHKFIEKQFQYFSYYRMFGITKGEFDYANGQAILYKYHDAFKTVKLDLTFEHNATHISMNLTEEYVCI